MSDNSVLVIGGGLAGMATALRLSEAGRAVTLLETRPRLGGRATSHVDQKTGEKIDNCQHVVMGCCTNVLDFYNRAGVGDLIEWHNRYHFMDKRGHHDLLYPGPLPAPQHLTGAMIKLRYLSFAQKMKIAFAMSRMMAIGVNGRERYSGMTFGAWLRDQAGQSDWLVKHYWDITIVSALNVTCDHSAAHHAMQVYQEGFLCHRKSFEMGLSKTPLLELYDKVAGIIEGHGGQVKTGVSVKSIVFENGSVSGVCTARDGVMTADHYVSAVPFDRLQKLLPEALLQADDRFQGLEKIHVSPILGIHLWYEQEPLPVPHVAFTDSPLHWAFNKGYDACNQAWLVHGVISAADAWMKEKEDAIIGMAHRELSGYFEQTLKAKLIRGRAIKEKRATFAPLPGVDQYRASNSGTIRNLTLSGDWTLSGWPATMEGAVRSGYRAAEAILGVSQQVPDLKPSLMFRWLSLQSKIFYMGRV